MEDSLSKLDRVLVDRITVPVKLLSDDYAGIGGSSGVDSDCEQNYRLLGNSWIAPWGSVSPWLLQPSTITKTPDNKTLISLQVPQSRVRHFLSDASLYIKLPQGSKFPKLTQVSLRLGSERVIQTIDSDFACNISNIYKLGRMKEDIYRYSNKDNSIIFPCPLFLDSPLRILPLFFSANTLPEISYILSGEPDIVLTEDNVKFLTEFVSSPGEAESSAGSKAIIQYIPSFLTHSVTVESGSTAVTVKLSGLHDGKLTRAIYIRVFSDHSDDIPDAIDTIELYGPPPKSQNFLGLPVPGFIARYHMKNRFSKLPSESLPYYVIPFCITPSGNVADYGLLLSPDSELILKLNPNIDPLDSVDTPRKMTVEVCVETFEKVVWKR